MRCCTLVPIGDISNPLKQYSKLMGVKFHEGPTAPLIDDDWPEELKQIKREEYLSAVIALVRRFSKWKIRFFL